MDDPDEKGGAATPLVRLAPDVEHGQRRPFERSLCWRCANHRPIETARSIFLMCRVLAEKYPRQPVATCPAFRQP